MTRKGESDLINPQSLCFKSAHIYKISEKKRKDKKSNNNNITFGG